MRIGFMGRTEDCKGRISAIIQASTVHKGHGSGFSSSNLGVPGLGD